MSVELAGDWFQISFDDYDEETLEDGTPLAAIAKVLSIVTGDVLFFGLVADEEPDDEDEDDV